MVILDWMKRNSRGLRSKKVKSGDSGIWRHENFCFIFEVHVKSCNVCPSSYIEDSITKAGIWRGPVLWGGKINLRLCPCVGKTGLYQSLLDCGLEPAITGKCSSWMGKKGRYTAVHRHALGSVGKACRDLGPFPCPF